MSAGGEEEGQVYCIASVKREHESVGIAVSSHPLECAPITGNLIRRYMYKRETHIQELYHEKRKKH